MSLSSKIIPMSDEMYYIPKEILTTPKDGKLISVKHVKIFIKKIERIVLSENSSITKWEEIREEAGSDLI